MERLRGWVGSVARALAELPVPLRYALVAGAAAGALGGLVGLVVGLRVYPPTAWFAIVEIGLPAAVVGAVLGAAVGSVRRVASGRQP